MAITLPLRLVRYYERHFHIYIHKTGRPGDSVSFSSTPVRLLCAFAAARAVRQNAYDAGNANTLLGNATAQNHPNIVIILADDLGYDDVGFNGSPDIPTPNLDALAANGALCTDGYVTAPYCSPSRAGLLTGRYQQRFGYDSEPQKDNDNPLKGLPMTEYTLAELLKPAGYVCGIYGKWHVGVAPDLFPLERGFDEFVGFLGYRVPILQCHALPKQY